MWWNILWNEQTNERPNERKIEPKNVKWKADKYLHIMPDIRTVHARKALVHIHTSRLHTVQENGKSKISDIIIIYFALVCHFPDSVLSLANCQQLESSASASALASHFGNQPIQLIFILEHTNSWASSALLFLTLMESFRASLVTRCSDPRVTPNSFSTTLNYAFVRSLCQTLYSTCFCNITRITLRQCQMHEQ